MLYHERNLYRTIYLLIFFFIQYARTHDFLPKHSIQMRFMYTSTIDPTNCFSTYKKYMDGLVSETYLPKLKAICDEKKYDVRFKLAQGHTYEKSKKFLYTFAIYVVSVDAKSHPDVCAELVVAKLLDHQFLAADLPGVVKFQKNLVGACEVLSLDKSVRQKDQRAIFFNNYPYCDQSHLYDAKAKLCKMQNTPKNIVSSPALVITAIGKFDKTPSAQCVYRTMNLWVYILQEYQVELTKLCKADFVVPNIRGDPIYDLKEVEKITQFGVGVVLFHNNHLLTAAEMNACDAKWKNVFDDKNVVAKDYGKLIDVQADSACPTWQTTNTQITDDSPKRMCTRIIGSDLDPANDQQCITRYSCRLSAKFTCLQTLSNYLYPMYIFGESSLKPKEPTCSSLDEYQRCADEVDARCDTEATAAISEAMSIHLDKARYTCRDRRGLITRAMGDRGTYDSTKCNINDFYKYLSKMRETSLMGIITKDKCSVGQPSILSMAAGMTACSMWARLLSLKDMNFYSSIAALTCSPEYNVHRYVGQCDTEKVAIAVYDIGKLVWSVGQKKTKVEDMCKKLDELLDQAYHASMGCLYRQMLDLQELVKDRFKSAITDCAKINVKASCDFDGIDKEMTKLVSTVTSLKLDKTKCSTATAQTSAIVKLASGCLPSTRGAVLASVHGHSSMTSTVCATELTADCRADAGILCLKDLMTKTNNAVTDPTGNSGYCKDVKANKLTDCVSKIVGTCKSLTKIVAMATKLQALLLKQSTEGCKGGNALSKLKQPFKCRRQAAADWLDKYNGRLLDSYLMEHEDKNICGYLLQAFKFGAHTMSFCNDALVGMVRRLYENLSDLTKSKCTAEREEEVDSGSAVMVSYQSTLPGDVTEGTGTGEVKIEVDTHPYAICLDVKNCKMEIEYAVSNKDPPSSHETKKPLPQVVFGDLKLTKKEEVCVEVIDKPTNLEVVYQASLDNFVDGEQKRDLEVYYKQTIDGKLVARRKARTFQITVKDSDKLGLCKLVGDPYVSTFDGSQYGLQSSGIYTIYKTKDDWSMVQVITHPCNHKKGLCTCAVAIKTGDDVIVLDRCRRPDDKKLKQFDSSREVKSDTQAESELAPLRVEMFVNGKLEETDITMLENYRIVGISLPQLTFVKVVSTDVDFDVYIMASFMDTDKTDGLCGTFTGKTDDDFRLADGKIFTGDKTKPDAFVKSWSVDPTKSIFKGVPASTAKPPVAPNAQYFQCVCVKGEQKCDKNLIVQAGALTLGNNGTSVTDKLSKQAKPKTSVLDHIATIVDTKFKPPTLSWPAGWTEQKATDECTKLVTKSAYSTSCKKVIRIDDSVKTCASQVKKSGQSSDIFYSMLWYQEECRYRSAVDASLKADVLTDLKEGLCLNDCSAKGTCAKGACTCEKDYTNEDCFGRPSTDVTIDTMENRGICDTKSSPCKTIRVYGRGFTTDKARLKCVLEEIEVTTNIKRSGKLLNAPATLGKFDEVLCTLPEARSYLVGISNQGGLRTTKAAARPVSLMVPFVVHDSGEVKCDPDTVTCKKEDKCIPSNNFKALTAFFEKAMKELMTDATKFKTTCGTAGASKAASMKATTQCTKPQIDIMGGFYDKANDNLLKACPLTDQLTEKAIDPSSCKSSEALKCTQDAIDKLHETNVANSALAKDEFCAALNGAASCMQSSAGTCSALTKGKLALGYDYMKSVSPEKCTNVQDLDWTRITDQDKCALSNNYDWLTKVAERMLDIKPNLAADWSDLCGAQTNMAAAASFQTKLCTKPEIEEMKKLHDNVVKPQFDKNCPASNKVDPGDASTCKTNLPKTGRCLSDPSRSLIDIAVGRNTKDKAKLCGKLLASEKCAKNSAHTCSTATKNAVTDDIKMARDLAGKNDCERTPVVWPKPKPDLAGKFEFNPKDLDLTEGQPAKNVNVAYKGDTKDLISDEEKKKGCFIVVEPALTGRDKVDPTHKVAIPQFKFHWKGNSSDLYCKDGTCGAILNEANGYKTSLPFMATLDRMVETAPKKRQILLRYKKICDGKVKAVEEIGRTTVNIKNGFKKNVCKSIGGPFVKTFDGRELNNFNQGYQTLYDYKDGQHTQKVETVQYLHGPSKATCMCAVSVQSGDDVFVVNRCPRKQTNIANVTAPTATTKLYKNGELTPGTKIFSHHSGNSYKVILPTGTDVDISVGPNCLSCYVRASPHDYKKSTGLCGFHDDDPKNDFKLKDGTSETNTDKQPQKFIEDNVVKPEDSIIAGVLPVQPPPPKKLYCNNYARTGSPALLETVEPQCRHDNVNSDLVNWDKNSEDITKSQESKSSRPNIVNNKVSPGPNAIDVPPKLPPLPKKIDLDQDEKKKLQDECKKRIADDAMVKKCADLLPKDFDVKDEIQACVLSVAANIGKKKEFMADAHMAARASCSNTVPAATGGSNSAVGPNMAAIPKLDCPADCKLRGSCKTARRRKRDTRQAVKETAVCVCKKGFSGHDCGIKATDKPKITSISQNGACNLRLSPCGNIPVTVSGMDFNKNEKHECKLEEIKVTDKQPYQRTGKVVTVPAVVRGKRKLDCLTGPNNSSYLVTPLVNGKPVAGSRPLIKYDGVCQTPNVADITMVPKLPKSYCVFDGKCLAAGEKLRPENCLVCEAKTWQLVTNKDAPKCSVVGAVLPGSSPWAAVAALPWWLIALLTFLAAMLLLLLLFLLLWCCCIPCCPCIVGCLSCRGCCLPGGFCSCCGPCCPMCMDGGLCATGGECGCCSPCCCCTGAVAGTCAGLLCCCAGATERNKEKKLIYSEKHGIYGLDNHAYTRDSRFDSETIGPGLIVPHYENSEDVVNYRLACLAGSESLVTNVENVESYELRRSGARSAGTQTSSSDSLNTTNVRNVSSLYESSLSRNMDRQSDTTDTNEAKKVTTITTRTYVPEDYGPLRFDRSSTIQGIRGLRFGREMNAEEVRGHVKKFEHRENAFHDLNTEVIAGEKVYTVKSYNVPVHAGVERTVTNRVLVRSSSSSSSISSVGVRRDVYHSSIRLNVPGSPYAGSRTRHVTVPRRESSSDSEIDTTRRSRTNTATLYETNRALTSSSSESDLEDVHNRRTTVVTRKTLLGVLVPEYLVREANSYRVPESGVENEEAQNPLYDSTSDSSCSTVVTRRVGHEEPVRALRGNAVRVTDQARGGGHLAGDLRGAGLTHPVGYSGNRSSHGSAHESTYAHSTTHGAGASSHGIGARGVVTEERTYHATGSQGSQGSHGSHGDGHRGTYGLATLYPGSGRDVPARERLDMYTSGQPEYDAHARSSARTTLGSTAHAQNGANQSRSAVHPANGWETSGQLYFLSKEEMDRYDIDPAQVTEYVYETRNEVESDVAEDVTVDRKRVRHRHRTNRL